MYPIKRDLDGIYYRVKRGDEWVNLCLSDLTEDERNDKLKNYSNEELMRLCNMLCGVIRNIGDSLDIFSEE